MTVSTDIQDEVVEQIARATHEANRVYCESIGDTSQLAWEQAPDWQKVSARKGVSGALAGNTPRQSHESWLAEKKATGWKFGPVKDAEKKQHPCFVPYDQLPPEQAIKDAIFVTVAKTMHRLITGSA